MILVDALIRKAVQDGSIVVDPFDPARLGTNSYDVRLGKNLLTYDVQQHACSDCGKTHGDGPFIDAAVDNSVAEMAIPPQGLLLHPNILYLGVTQEYTESWEHVPFLDGKSSVGRLGVFIHATAGRGDVGFCGHWTMEISVVQPVRVYAGMPIGQLYWFTTACPPEMNYANKAGAKYGGVRQANPRPTPSKMWKNFPLKEER